MLDAVEVLSASCLVRFQVPAPPLNATNPSAGSQQNCQPQPGCFLVKAHVMSPQNPSSGYKIQTRNANTNGVYNMLVSPLAV